MTRNAALRFKRVIDVVAAAFGLLLLSPFLLLVALVIRWRFGSPVIFSQVRPGLNAEPFVLRKFRTMREVFDESGAPLPDELRMTRLGSFLRSTSIDELPELVNILRGEMSLVGPRPLLTEYLRAYSARQSKRHLMRPGLTGLSQVSGRNGLSWQDRLELDVRYVEQWNLRLDFMILLRTVRTVIFRRGVAAEGHVTMPLFTQNGSTNPDGAEQERAKRP